MKKQIILGSLIALAGFIKGQSTIAGNSLSGTLPTSPTQYLGSSNAADVIFRSNFVERMRILSSGSNAGFIGIGTNTPLYKIDLVSTETDGGIRLSQNTGGAARLILKNNTAGGIEWSVNSLGSGNSHGAGNFSIYDNTAISRFFIQNNTGNIGIGTITPIAKLNLKQTSGTAFQIDQTSTGNYEYAQVVNVSSDLTKALSIQRISGANTTNVFQIWGNGVVNAKSVYAEALTVTPTAIGITWPDYVFKTGYKLMPLIDLEKYILTNHHLPNVPSTKEVEKDGVNLYEINKALLEKIEELSLYVIELNKKIELIQKK